MHFICSKQIDKEHANDVTGMQWNI